MRQINGTGGLCITCNNLPTCYYNARRGPALFCELFDDHVGPVGSPGEPTVSPSRGTARGTEKETKTFVGLCMNCEHRLTCMHPKPTGGIWHCEDYE